MITGIMPVLSGHDGAPGMLICALRAGDPDAFQRVSSSRRSVIPHRRAQAGVRDPRLSSWKGRPRNPSDSNVPSGRLRTSRDTTRARAKTSAPARRETEVMAKMNWDQAPGGDDDFAAGGEEPTIASRYARKCATCGQRFVVGDPVASITINKKPAYHHGACRYPATALLPQKGEQFCGPHLSRLVARATPGSASDRPSGARRTATPWAIRGVPVRDSTAKWDGPERTKRLR